MCTGEQGAPSLPLRSPNPRIFHLAHKEGQTLQRFILYDTPRDELPLLDIAKVALGSDPRRFRGLLSYRFGVCAVLEGGVSSRLLFLL